MVANVSSSEVSSLRPSDSASQVLPDVKPLPPLPSDSNSSLPLPYPRAIVRPSTFPPSVLWTLEDCQNDPDAGVSRGNKSRPPMRRAIRHEDGSMITDSQWKAIRESATIVARTHLDHLKTPVAARPSRKKSFFKQYFLKEWVLALRELETMAPLLSLCSPAWKADQTLGSVLQQDDAMSEPPSRASTPSSIAPASRVLPSSNLGSSRIGPPSSVAPSSSDLRSSSHARSNRRVSFKSLQAASGAEQPPPDPAPASKATGPKAKRRRDPSPAARTGKRTKGDEPTSSVSAGTF